MPLSTACSVVLFVGGAQKPFFVSPQADMFDIFGGFLDVFFLLFPLCSWDGGGGKVELFFGETIVFFFSLFLGRVGWNVGMLALGEALMEGRRLEQEITLTQPMASL